VPRPGAELFTPTKEPPGPRGVYRKRLIVPWLTLAAGDVRKRLVAGVAARYGFATLVPRQLARAAEQYGHEPWRACGPRWCGQ
jgi:hypothetical protein